MGTKDDPATKKDERRRTDADVVVEEGGGPTQTPIFTMTLPNGMPVEFHERVDAAVADIVLEPFHGGQIHRHQEMRVVHDGRPDRLVRNDDGTVGRPAPLLGSIRREPGHAPTRVLACLCEHDPQAQDPLPAEPGNLHLHGLIEHVFRR